MTDRNGGSEKWLNSGCISQVESIWSQHALGGCGTWDEEKSEGWLCLAWVSRKISLFTEMRKFANTAFCMGMGKVQ